MSRRRRPATRKSRSSGIRASKPKSAQKSILGPAARPEPGIHGSLRAYMESTFHSYGIVIAAPVLDKPGHDTCGCVDFVSTRRWPDGNHGFPMGYTSIAMSAMSTEPPSSSDQSPKSSPKTRPSVVEIANCAIVAPFGIYPVLPLVRLGRKKVRCTNGVSVRPGGARRRQ
jgi:hypothetical protein